MLYNILYNLYNIIQVVIPKTLDSALLEYYTNIKHWF